MKSGNLFIVAAPSGGGKTTLVKALAARQSSLHISISHTTRTPRPSEVDGKSYYFVDEKAFLKMISEQAFVEHAKVFGHHYGTSKREIEERLENGVDVLLDIDWQGALQIKKLYPKSESIFIVPPSLEVLKARLSTRKEDSKETIEYRMQHATSEMSHFQEFDYLICNDDFDRALHDLETIIQANRLSCWRQEEELAKQLSLLLASK